MTENDIKIRCSLLDTVMPSDNARGTWTETQLTKLVEIHTDLVDARREEVDSKFLSKGTECEEDSITLLSRITKQVFIKNEKRLQNEYITGLPDLFIGASIELADEIIDIKTSFSLNTFKKAKIFQWWKKYKYQMQGYMALTGAKKASVAFCLVNGLAVAINDEKRRLQWKSTKIDYETDPVYIEKCKQVEINHIYDIQHFNKENPGYSFHNDIDLWLEEKTWDIPMEERLHIFEVPRDEEVIKKIYVRVKECRDWLNSNMFI